MLEKTHTYIGFKVLEGTDKIRSATLLQLFGWVHESLQAVKMKPQIPKEGGHQ